MKAVAKALFISSLAVMLTMTFVAGAAAQEKMKMEEYRLQLKSWADKESAAKAEIADCDAKIAALTSEKSDVVGQIAGTWSEIYAAIGVSESDVNAYRQELNALDQELNALAALSPEDLFKRRKEIDEIEAKLEEMKGNRIYALTEMRNKVAGMEGKIAQLRAKMPKGMYDEYTVTRGDYLWRIARKSDVYGDPFQWVRIYSMNTDQITDPDLIYPDQIFKIHRESGPHQYLVGRGDNLSKIVGSMEMMGDPTKWQDLYEANKDVIGDEPSLIYPYQVLKIPGN